MIFGRNKVVPIYAPFESVILNLEHVNDEVFSKKHLGVGIALSPNIDFGDELVIYNLAPNCIGLIFSSGYAIHYEHKQFAFMIHIGTDTYHMRDEGVTYKQHYLNKYPKDIAVLKIDTYELKKRNFSMVSPIVIIDNEQIEHIEYLHEEGSLVHQGEKIIDVFLI